MHALFAVGLGGFLGAVGRYLLSGFVHRFFQGPFPAGTLVVNTVGCLLIGVVMGLVQRGPWVGPQARVFLGVGLLGSFTTFSTLQYESVELVRDGDLRGAALNLGLSLLLGIAAVLIGETAGRALAA